jgi:hypothetical protein
MISIDALARDLYSASVLDLDTVYCFLALHDTRFVPRNIANPPIDLLSSRLPTQSTSVKPLTGIDDDFVICKPRPIIPLINHKILLTVVRCVVVGEWRYWQTLLTENAMSGRVKVKYCKPPTILR